MLSPPDTHTLTHTDTVLSHALSSFPSLYISLCCPVRDPIDPLMRLANQTTTLMQLKPDYSSSLWSVTEGAERVAAGSALSRTHTHSPSYKVEIRVSQAGGVP